MKLEAKLEALREKQKQIEQQIKAQRDEQNAAAARALAILARSNPNVTSALVSDKVLNQLSKKDQQLVKSWSAENRPTPTTEPNKDAVSSVSTGPQTAKTNAGGVLVNENRINHPAPTRG